MTVTFPALGPVTVVADPYVPRTISLDDGTVALCLDCLPEPAICEEPTK